jgi:hypothetical protein
VAASAGQWAPSGNTSAHQQQHQANGEIKRDSNEILEMVTRDWQSQHGGIMTTKKAGNSTEVPLENGKATQEQVKQEMKVRPLLDGGQGKSVHKCCDSMGHDRDRAGVETLGKQMGKHRRSRGQRAGRRRRQHQRKRAREQMPPETEEYESMPPLAVREDSSDDESRVLDEQAGEERPEVAAELGKSDNEREMESRYPGLRAPKLKSGDRINGANKRQHRRENKAKRIAKQEAQEEGTYWSTHQGTFSMPETKEELEH